MARGGTAQAVLPENKRHFLDVAADVVGRVDPVFYLDPMAATMKALGMS